jgi:hypothetical protein
LFWNIRERIAEVTLETYVRTWEGRSSTTSAKLRPEGRNLFEYAQACAGVTQRGDTVGEIQALHLKVEPVKRKPRLNISPRALVRKW